MRWPCLQMKTLCTFVLNKQHNMGGIGLVEDLEKQKNLKRCRRTLQKRGVYQKVKWEH